MKIECPNCKLSGQVSDANIPPEGRGMECPRCKTNIFVQKKATANWADTISDCPECGYSTFSTERFDICSRCGLDVKEFNKKGKKVPPAVNAEFLTPEPAAVHREQMLKDLERLEREDHRKRMQRLESAGSPQTMSTQRCRISWRLPRQ